MSKSNKIIIIILIVLAITTFAFVFIYSAKSQNKTITNPVVTPVSKITTSPSSSISLSKPTMSPTISPNLSPSPAPTATPDLKIPSGEKLVMSGTEDTNGDGKKETLVITEKTDKKIHAYILSSAGASIYDVPDLGQKPVRIATQKYSDTDNFKSWMLIFTEESGSLAMIHWNGTKYEIPTNEGGI